MINIEFLQEYAIEIFYVINEVFVPILFAVAFITFLWGVFNYFILGATDDSKLKTGRQFVLWGIIGFVVMASVWGLVYMTRDTLGFTPTVSPPPPTIFTY